MPRSRSRATRLLVQVSDYLMTAALSPGCHSMLLPRMWLREAIKAGANPAGIKHEWKRMVAIQQRKGCPTRG